MNDFECMVSTRLSIMSQNCNASIFDLIALIRNPRTASFATSGVDSLNIKWFTTTSFRFSEFFILLMLLMWSLGKQSYNFV